MGVNFLCSTPQPLPHRLLALPASLTRRSPETPQTGPAQDRAQSCLPLHGGGSPEGLSPLLPSSSPLRLTVSNNAIQLFFASLAYSDLCPRSELINFTFWTPGAGSVSVRAVLCTSGWEAASLGSTQQAPVAPPHW